MLQNETYFMNGIILIDKFGNRYCDLNRYQDAIVCIVYDASSIMDDNVQRFSNSKNPNTLPSSNGIFVATETTTGEWFWKNITNELRVLRMNRIIDFVEWGFFR